MCLSILERVTIPSMGLIVTLSQFKIK